MAVEEQLIEIGTLVARRDQLSAQEVEGQRLLLQLETKAQETHDHIMKIQGAIEILNEMLGSVQNEQTTDPPQGSDPEEPK